MSELLAEGRGHREHHQRFRELLSSTDGIVRIASAYVTDRDLLVGTKNRSIRLMTSLLPMDIASGATSLESLRAIVESGVNCRGVSSGGRLHAKVYIFGEVAAVVTSANLTYGALESNIEVGIEIRDHNVNSLIEWFDDLWRQARQVELAEIAEWEQRIMQLRVEHSQFMVNMKLQLKSLFQSHSTTSVTDELRDLLTSDTAFFVCNSNRGRVGVLLEATFLNPKCEIANVQLRGKISMATSNFKST